VREGAVRWIGRLPESLDLLEFLAPQFVNLVVECQGTSFRGEVNP
jgi:hypothetical protein